MRRVQRPDDDAQGAVEDFVGVGYNVIAGGQFDFVKKDVRRSRLAEVGGDYGGPTKWAPTLYAQPPEAGLIVNDLDYNAGVLAVAGEFHAVDGASRENLAFFNTQGAAPALANAATLESSAVTTRRRAPVRRSRKVAGRISRVPGR